MISKFAVKKFLEAKRLDFRKYKQYSPEAMELMVKKLPTKPPIWNKLRHEQKICFLIGAAVKRFAFILDTGVGKTLLSIALARYFRKAGKVDRFLVLVPNKINKYEWVREIEKHSPKTQYLVLEDSSEEKWEQIRQTDALLIIATYSSVVHMTCDHVPSKKKADKNVMKPNAKLVGELAELVDGLILDESTAVQNHKSLTFRVCRKLSQSVKSLFELTGTPFGRDPTPLWTQLYLVDHGETLGPTLGLFRAVFFNESKNYWSGGFNYTFDKKKKKLLHRIIANRTIRYKARETDLPKVIRIIKQLELPMEAQAYYDKAREALLEAKGNFIETKNMFLRMRQISSGFVGYFDDDTAKRAELDFTPNVKLDATLDLVQSIADEYKIVIFHEFIFSGSVICRELGELGIGHARVWGGSKDSEKELRRFVDDPECRVFVVNNQAGAYGLNLQVANYVIYYESPTSVIVRKQTRRRVERQGSEHEKVFVYDMVVRDTMDQRILDFHRQGGDLFEAIIEGKVSGLI